MKNTLLTLMLLLTMSATGYAQSMLDTLGTVRYFTLNDGQMMAFPERYIQERSEDAKQVRLTLMGDTTIVITKAHIASESTELYTTLPEITSFKFNNKFNDQLYTDAIGEIDQQTGNINVDVVCIGKRLAPSFQLTDGAQAYVDGILQHSKKTRRRFTEPTTYTVAFPKNWIYKPYKITEEVWSQPEPDDPGEQWIYTPVELTADMLSTNAPSNVGEDPYRILDGDPGTFFHSTYGTGQYEKLTWYEGCSYGDGVSVWPYLEIALPEPLDAFTFSYITRPHSGYALEGFIIQGSNDGKTWDEIRTFKDKEDNLPLGASETYDSPVLLCKKAYARLRMQLTGAQHKNYLVLAEFSLNKVSANPNYGQTDKQPELLVPAEYKWGFVPLGRDYKVNVRYLTDHSKGEYRVPTIYINTYDGTMITSKKYYWEATFEIDGAGIYPDLKVESMLIRGRGNSSWTTPSYWNDSKNPYRLKFPEKIKPFGLTKGKSWVLLANKQSNSMTTNAIAMRVADMVQSKGCNHIIPVELYINGQYRGSYNFTEKVGFSNNSIDIEDETNAVMLELDQYYDETYKFMDKSYALPVNIKEPDFAELDFETELSPTNIKEKFDNFTYTLRRGGSEPYASMIDVEAFCRAMLVIDFTRNTEANHPKSFYIYNENPLADSVWVFGPVWDFDWSYGYEGSHTYFVNNANTDLFATLSSEAGALFLKAALRYSETVKKEYYRVWTQFMQEGRVDELIEFVDDYYEFVQPSFAHNAEMWGDGRNNYPTINKNSKNWLAKRADYIYGKLTKYDLGDDIIQVPGDEEFGQPDRIDLAKELQRPVDVYNLGGIRIRHQVPVGAFNVGLAPGIYIVEGRKIVVK